MGRVEEMEQGGLIGPVGVIDGRAGGGFDLREAGKLWAGHQIGAGAGGPDAQQVGFAVIGPAPERQTVLWPEFGARQPDARRLIGGRGQEILACGTGDMRQIERQLARAVVHASGAPSAWPR